MSPSQGSADNLAQRIDNIERGYEYLLAYAAQGRLDDAGSDARKSLVAMRDAIDGLPRLAAAALTGAGEGVLPFLHALERDAAAALGIVELALSRPRISSLLVDNLNASVHVRALLTDLFLVEQSLAG